MADHPVPIAELPHDLEAFPVYRVRAQDDGRSVSTLLRLEVRAANPSSATSWHEHLQEIDARTRGWLLKQQSGHAATISKRLGDQTTRLLYRWCAQGIVVLTVKPPSGPNAPHSGLLGWRLTPPALAFAEEVAAHSMALKTKQMEEASELAAQLADTQEGRDLATVLIELKDHSYLAHAIASARTVLASTPAQVMTGGERAPFDRWGVVRQLARGIPTDYALDKEPMTGGQAYVYGGHHKASRVPVAYKRLKTRDADSIARMRREIEAGTLFGSHPHVMPVLDADPESSWFVMPLADSTARKEAEALRKADRLIELLVASCDALKEPHAAGWIHRDLKPDNLLTLGGRWMVADWGLARRPRGMTSDPGRTRTGTGYGTEGFAAPELALDAHQVGPAADIYSLGQLIGSILTGRTPQANISLIPPQEPWARIVARATRFDPAERYSGVDEFLDDVTKIY